MYYENMKENRKIVNHYKLLEICIHLYILIP